MRPAAREVLLRLGAAVLATLVLAPFVAPLFAGEPVHRVLTRFFLGALVVAFLVRRGHPRTWRGKLAEMGLRGPDRLRRFAWGAAAGLVLLAALLVVSWLLGGRTSPTEPYPVPLAGHVGKALLMAVGVAWFEEIVCRGYLKDTLGGLGSALLYAGAHYFRPLAGSPPAGSAFDPLLGVRNLPRLFESWSEPRNATLGLLSLLLFGLALNRLRERTGTLYAGMGLHAGLVFAVELYRRFLDGAAAGDPWVHGGPRLHDGVLGTLAMALLLLAASRLRLPSALRP